MNLEKTGEKPLRLLSQLNKSKYVWYLVSTIILAVLIYTADVNKFITAARSIEPFYLVSAYIAGASIFFVWGYVWYSFLSRLDIEKNAWKSFKMFLAGNFMNAITPLGQVGGEPFMAYIISENTDSSYEKSLTSVISADMINTVPFITFGAIGVFYMLLFGATHFLSEGALLLILASLIVLAAGMYLVWFDRSAGRKTINKIMKVFESRFPSLKRYNEEIKEKLREIGNTFEKIGDNRRHLVKTAAIAHIGPLTQFLCLYLIVKGQGFEPHITGIYLTVLLSVVAIFTPTPGGAGTYEAVFSGLLVLFYPEMALQTAVLSAIFFRITTYWTEIPVGYISLLSLRRGELS